MLVVSYWVELQGIISHRGRALLVAFVGPHDLGVHPRQVVVDVVLSLVGFARLVHA